MQCLPLIPLPSSRKLFLTGCGPSSWWESLPLPDEVTLLWGDNGAWSEVMDWERLSRENCLSLDRSQSETLFRGCMAGVTDKVWHNCAWRFCWELSEREQLKFYKKHFLMRLAPSPWIQQREKHWPFYLFLWNTSNIYIGWSYQWHHQKIGSFGINCTYCVVVELEIWTGRVQR